MVLYSIIGVARWKKSSAILQTLALRRGAKSICEVGDHSILGLQAQCMASGLTVGIRRFSCDLATLQAQLFIFRFKARVLLAGCWEANAF